MSSKLILKITINLPFFLFIVATSRYGNCISHKLLLKQLNKTCYVFVSARWSHQLRLAYRRLLDDMELMEHLCRVCSSRHYHHHAFYLEACPWIRACRRRLEKATSVGKYRFHFHSYWYQGNYFSTQHLRWNWTVYNKSISVTSHSRNHDNNRIGILLLRGTV